MSAAELQPAVKPGGSLLGTSMQDPIDRILIECLRVDLKQAGSAQSVASLFSQDVDWESLLVKAQMHGTLGWLHEVMVRFEPGIVPEHVLARFKDARIKQTARVALMSRDLREVSAGLDEAGIEHIMLKGPYLAECVYERSDLRYYTDLDLMVREADVSRAGEVFAALGYRLVEEGEQGFFDRGKTQVHYHRDGCLPIDLHWEIINLPTHDAAFAVDEEKIWGAARRTDVSGISLMTLSPEDSLLFQCVHMTAHHDCNRLQWFKDVQQVIQRYGSELDWRLFTSEATDYRLRTFVYYALAFTEEVCRDTGIPPWVLDELKPDYLTARLFERLLSGTNIFELQGQKRKPALEIWRVMRDDSSKRYSAIFRRVFPSVGWYLECYPFLPKIKRPNYYYALYPALILLRLFKMPRENL